MDAAQTKDVLNRAYAILADLPDFSAHTMEEALHALVETLQLKPGQVFGAIRSAVTGQPVSPPLFESMEIIGKTVSLARMARAAATL